MSDFDPTTDALPLDWRGNEIGLFTKVLYHPSSRYGGFKIGEVTALRNVGKYWDGTPIVELDIKWTEESGSGSISGKARGVSTDHVMVFREGPN